MKDTISWIAVGIAIFVIGYALLYPYYSLGNLKSIAEELEKIRKGIEKITSGGINNVR